MSLTSSCNRGHLRPNSATSSKFAYVFCLSKRVLKSSGEVALRLALFRISDTVAIFASSNALAKAFASSISSSITEGSRVMYDLVITASPRNINYSHFAELITSTDELTIFATIGQILGTEKYYVTIKAESGSKLSTLEDARYNYYTTDKQGDNHCRGVRIVINNTFTASGKVAPICATIHGLSRQEMPGDDNIIAIPIPGLVRGTE